MTAIISIGVHIECCSRRSEAKGKKETVGEQKFEVGDGGRSFPKSSHRGYRPAQELRAAESW